MYVTPSYEVEIWRFIPRWEQDEDDGSIDRLEPGRILQMEYDDFNDPVNTSYTFTVTLEGAISKVA